MSERLLGAVLSFLRHAGIGCALIGGEALAVRGVARSTFDTDLLTTDRRALDATTWTTLQADPRLTVTVRRAGADDPLDGVVRIEALGERPVDLIVGRLWWQAAAVERAETIRLWDLDVPVLSSVDLILLKLYAGGTQDAWDIEQLLAAGERGALVDAVSRVLDELPVPARAMWARITSGR